VTLPLAPLETLPRLRRAELEEVGMPAPHLRLEQIGDVAGAEIAALFGNDQLKRDVQQDIAQLDPNGLGVAVAKRIVELQDFLDQVGTQGLTGLGTVPGTALPEIANHRESTSKR
jgi:hypothetical protein